MLARADSLPIGVNIFSRRTAPALPTAASPRRAMRPASRSTGMIALLIAAASAPALAQPAHPPGRPMPPQQIWDSRGWVQLGERTVNGRYDHDRIEVGRYEG